MKDSFSGLPDKILSLHTRLILKHRQKEILCKGLFAELPRYKFQASIPTHLKRLSIQVLVFSNVFWIFMYAYIMLDCQDTTYLQDYIGNLRLLLILRYCLNQCNSSITLDKLDMPGTSLARRDRFQGLWYIFELHPKVNWVTVFIVQ